MTTVQVGPVGDLTELGRRWRALEQRAGGSFFQSWTWMGCLAGERYDDPVLVEAAEDGRTVALALFNRRRHVPGFATLYLHESGVPKLDSPYIEQNGVLAEAGREAELTALCLATVARHYRVVLSGLEGAAAVAVRQAAGLTVVRRRQPAPFADLAMIRRTSGDVTAAWSANTRQQVRRSDRDFQQHGAIGVRCAASLTEAETLLDQLAALHQASWQARGQNGSFAEPFFRRFHRALIAEGLPRGEIALLHVSAGEVTIGVLYNFVWRGRMLAYQSGLAYQPGAARAKPGLSCHHAAMRYALEHGLDVYDFLAGDSRYKRSLSRGDRPMMWLACGPVFRPDLLAEWFRQRVGDVLS